MYSIGIDIGTTSLCGLVLDTESRRVLKSITVSNGSEISGVYPWQRCQDPHVIIGKCCAILEQLLEEYPHVETIGVTGQMHGILYCDREGKAISSLYT